MPGPLVVGAGIAARGIGKAQKKKAVQEQKSIYEKGGVGLRDYSKGRSKGQAAKKDVIGPKGEIIKKGRK